jgi:hypothetical protein
MNYPYTADSLKTSLDDPLGLLETVRVLLLRPVAGITMMERRTELTTARYWDALNRCHRQAVGAENLGSVMRPADIRWSNLQAGGCVVHALVVVRGCLRAHRVVVDRVRGVAGECCSA